MSLPGVSIVIPVYNSGWIIEECLRRIKEQDYPKAKIEVILADGGSTDDTLKIARRMGVKRIFDNKLKTGEAGKAVGVKKAKKDILALVDSDNLLPDRGWLKRMVAPFADKQVFASEPWDYDWRAGDGFITRWSALLGMNDPLCFFLGNYDRRNGINGRWTGLDLKQEDKGGWIKVELEERKLPTIGANGFLIRRKDLLSTQVEPFLFDIDCVYDLVKAGRRHVAKVKCGIIHLYCRGLGDFARKQRRRVRDYLYYKAHAMRRYPWGGFSKWRLGWFVVASLLVLPTLLQALRGFVKKPDPAWFFHPVACLSTLFVYGFATLRGMFLGRQEILDRKGWK